MTYDERLQKVSVLGAAGKMGSGILLLTAVEMAQLSLKPENKGKSYVLHAIDVSEEGLAGLMSYLRSQLRKIAEKNSDQLRQHFPAGQESGDPNALIEQYVQYVMDKVKTDTRLEAAYDSYLIFEAIAENQALKVRVFQQIDHNNPHKAWFFTNTSSIPIHVLDREAQLDGRILGFHFYNPPAVQRLVELITTSQNSPEMIAFAEQYARNLKKVVVRSNDFAGFIGNGHFMRDALHGIHEAEKLMATFSFPEAIYIVNRVAQDFLIRPMGIFQLIDYVGIDVVRFIMAVMNPYLPDEDLHSPLLDKLFDMGIKGGQHPDGSQKDGFFKYEKGKPVAVFDLHSQSYVPVAELQARCDEYLGPLPEGHQPWKTLNFSPEKETLLQTYFNHLKVMETPGASLAREYLKRSREIGRMLVSSGVARNEQDVNTVLLTGFYHAYGPIHSYID